MAENGQERYAFDRLVEVGRAAGFLPGKLTVLVDTTPQRGAGAVQDTYTLIRKGIQRVLKAAGYQAIKRRRRLAPNLATYLEHGGKAKIDWADPKARASQLQVLVRDAEAALALAKSCQDDRELGSAIWVLQKILGDDVSRDEEGTPELRQGVAADRIVSVTDPEMRHGHKSKAQHFEGRKLQVAEEATSELLVAVEPLAANVGDGKEFPQLLQQIEERHDLSLERVIADGAYGTGDNRADCAARRIELLSPLSRGRDPEVDPGPGSRGTSRPSAST